MTKENTRHTLARLSGAACATAAFLYWQNYGLVTERYTVTLPVPESFDGFKILQVSDYHNTRVLENKIAKRAREANPDIIAVTGDLFDSRRYDEKSGVRLIKRLSRISPVYFSSGNHEAKLENFDRVKKLLEDAGAKIADNRKFTLKREDRAITIMGMPDPQFYLEKAERGKRPGRKPRDEVTVKVRGLFKKDLLSLCRDDKNAKLLLSHRPELLHIYRQAGIDLVLSGHAHGGQFGIPFSDRGVYVPNQGFFPKYSGGKKVLGSTVEIISRGVGNSVFPQRLFNRPRLVLVRLRSA